MASDPAHASLPIVADDDLHDGEPDLEILTTVPGSAEATIVVGDLEAAGIKAMQRATGKTQGLWGTPAACDILVFAQDLDRARELLDSYTLSEEELVEAEEAAAASERAQPGTGEE
jgi:Putative prokaryotic signal transducing protein